MIGLRVIFFLVFSISLNFSQASPIEWDHYDMLSSNGKKWVDSVLHTLTPKTMVQQLLWTKHDSTINNDVYGGIIFSSLEQMLSRKCSKQQGVQYKALNTYEGIHVSGFYNAYPSYFTRKAAKAHNDGFDKYIYQKHNVFNIDFNPKPKEESILSISVIDGTAQISPIHLDSILISKNKYDFLLVRSALLENEIAEIFTAKRKTLKILKAKVKECLAAKYVFILQQSTETPPINTRSLEKEIYNTLQKSVTLVKNNNILPLATLDTLNVCVATSQTDKMNPFVSEINKYLWSPHYTYSEDNCITDQIEKLSHYDIVLLPVIRVDDNFINGIKRLIHKTNVVLIDFGNNELIANWSSQKNIPITYIKAYSTENIVQGLIAQTIFGAYGFQGVLPYSIGSFHSGMGIATKPLNRLRYTPPYMVDLNIDTLNIIDDIMKEAIVEKATPGGQILVAKSGHVVYNKQFGYQTYDSLLPITENTMYDLASLTKVLATTQAIMFLEERGMIALDNTISAYLPEMKGTNKEFITLREVLTHQAGLHPYIPFWKRALNKKKMTKDPFKITGNDYFQLGRGLYSHYFLTDSLWNWSVTSDLMSIPSKGQAYGYKYSDIGFFILKEIAERQLGQNMGAFLSQNLYRPLGVQITYSPLCNFPSIQIAPTESDHLLRNELLTGFVHDRNAAIAGGVAGHAGLFSNANDIAKLIQMLLNGGNYGNTNFYYSSTITNFTKQHYVDNRRGLGWDKPNNEDDGPSSIYCSSQTYGHTGFTGTSVWVDPAYDLIYIFLSNRVYPSSDNLKLIENNIRTRIHDKIYEAIEIINIVTY